MQRWEQRMRVPTWNAVLWHSADIRAPAGRSQHYGCLGHLVTSGVTSCSWNVGRIVGHAVEYRQSAPIVRSGMSCYRLRDSRRPAKRRRYAGTLALNLHGRNSAHLLTKERKLKKQAGSCCVGGIPSPWDSPADQHAPRIAFQ